MHFNGDVNIVSDSQQAVIFLSSYQKPIAKNSGVTNLVDVNVKEPLMDNQPCTSTKMCKNIHIIKNYNRHYLDATYRMQAESCSISLCE